MSLQKKLFGRLADGRDVYEFILKNTSGMTVKIISYGATVREMIVPDRNGNYADVVGGYDDLNSYRLSSRPMRRMKSVRSAMRFVMLASATMPTGTLSTMI